MNGRLPLFMRRLITSAVLAFSVQGAFAQVDAGLPELPAAPRSQLPTPDQFADGQMKALDTNGDRKVTWSEFSARLRKAFDEMDTKRRGFLTRAELKAAYEKALAEMPRMSMQ